MLHGSIQIFKYLLKCNVELNPYLWIYAIHGQNYEMIHLLEENNIIFDKYLYEEIIKESIKCHCHDLTDYILNQYDEKFKFSVLKESIKQHNYISLSSKVDDLLMNIEENIFILCEYDYIHIVDILIKGKEIVDINKIKIIEYNDDFDEDIEEDDENSDFDDYNSINKQETTLLYQATINENVEIVQILLEESNIDINHCYSLIKSNESSGKIEYSCHKTVLNIAVEHENIDIVKSLLSNKNIDVNIKNVSEKSDDKNEETALSIAIDKENFEILELLLKNPKIDVQSKLIHSYIPIEYEDYDYKDIEEMPILFLAVQKKNQEIIKLLLSKSDIDVNSVYKIITYEEDENNEYTVELKRYERTALHEAVEKKDIEIIKLLLTKNDIDVNSFAHFKNEIEDYYTTYDFDEVEYNKTPLYIAVSEDSPEIVELLLTNNKIDPNIISLVYYMDEIKKDEEEDDERKIGKYRFNFTALHLAVFHENFAIINILMNNKSTNINTENLDGVKPIDITDNEKIKELFNNYNQ